MEKVGNMELQEKYIQLEHRQLGKHRQSKPAKPEHGNLVQGKVRLRSKEISDYRAEQLSQQHSRCALCDDVIIDDAVLDHDHKSGLIRRVLHRGCNSMLGKIENNMPRSRMDMNRLRIFASRLIEYLEQEHTEILHPTYKTPEEKKMGKGRGRGKGKKPPKR